MIPTTQYPKLLGVTFDSLFRFAKHATDVCTKLSTRNRILRALAGTSWGKDKETIVTTYKAIGRSVVNYAAPIWSPSLSDTQWSRLQSRQHNAVSTAIGCHQMAHPDHLHQEIKMLKVEQHNMLLTKQFALQCLNPEHPVYVLASTAPPQRIRNTFRTYTSEVSPLAPEIWDPRSSRLALDRVHQLAVVDATENQAPNRVLETLPPPIHDSEKTLPRTTRCTLSQLRSGWSIMLQTYNARIQEGVSDICPDCHTSPHTTSHLFTCPAHPTTLTPIDLWHRPVEVAHFLGLEI